MIPVTAVRVDEAAQQAVLEVLRSGQLSQGGVVERLEDGLRRFLGVDHVVTVNSGTSALVAALSVLGLGPGDEVVTSPFTFGATVNAIVHAGATVRFADVDPDDLTLDVAAAAAAVTPRTAALLPVHLYGQPADLRGLRAVADRRGLAMVEDAAQSFGATFDGVPVGTVGLGAFSFYATKGFTTGEGGAVTTSDSGLDGQLRRLRNQGMRGRYDYDLVGHNFRLTDVQAAIGLSQLPGADAVITRRQDNAARLSAALGDVPGLRLPVVRPGRRHVFHQYTVRVTDDARLTRDELQRSLAERGVQAAVFYPRAVYDHACYRRHPRVSCEPMPQAEMAARQVLSLPVHAHLTMTELDHVAVSVRDLLDA
jgi:dTDP-4-amino-4,6-dideoxygalactose transaminase